MGFAQKKKKINVIEGEWEKLKGSGGYKNRIKKTIIQIAFHLAFHEGVINKMSEEISINLENLRT